MKKITSFQGEYRFLSNFYPAFVYYSELKFPTAEHAYVAAKTTNQILREEISKIKHPAEAKKFGRIIELRNDWEKVRLYEMRKILESKFSDTALWLKLQETAPAYLEEGNTWGDRFWGVCNGIGQNHLGKILMSIRDDITKFA
jgi:N-glycosidase YbiA